MLYQTKADVKIYSTNALQESIVKVLKEESRSKTKFDAAKTYCFQKLTDYRCEERRRVGFHLLSSCCSDDVLNHAVYHE